MSQKYKNTVTKLDDKQEIHLPLDYSFKAVTAFSDLLREKKRSRGKSIVAIDGEVPDEETVIEKSNATSIKMNNNLLNQWDDFSSSMHQIFVDPALTLSWIDLSFNDLRSIDECLVGLPNLMMLYLHGNNIYTVSQVDKLGPLNRLKSLTLHGNPVEISPGYRFYVVSRLPQLQTFDFSGITKEERGSAETWQRMYGKRTREKNRAEDRPESQ